jgi:hypothetical protein
MPANSTIQRRSGRIAAERAVARLGGRKVKTGEFPGAV